ncbi:hypothetical protein BGX31_007496, partial [Mortierella sp. GBA43]
MVDCEVELYRNINDIVGPSLAAVFGKAIIDQLQDVSGGVLCVVARSIENMAKGLAHGVKMLAIEIANADRKTIMYAALGAAIGLALALVAPQLVGALGFGIGGITAGSPAAALMASYEGYVTVGSLCAILQSIGAVGLSAAVTALLGLLGAAIGGLLGAIFGDFRVDD